MLCMYMLSDLAHPPTTIPRNWWVLGDGGFGDGGPHSHISIFPIRTTSQVAASCFAIPWAAVALTVSANMQFVVIHGYNRGPGC